MAHTNDWINALNRIAPIALGKPTGTLDIFVNQGGIQNRNVPKEDKFLFKETFRLSGFTQTRRIRCHIAEGKLKFCTFPQK